MCKSGQFVYSRVFFFLLLISDNFFKPHMYFYYISIYRSLTCSIQVDRNFNKSQSKKDKINKQRVRVYGKSRAYA
jgi:hypothetical protein